MAQHDDRGRQEIDRLAAEAKMIRTTLDLLDELRNAPTPVTAPELARRFRFLREIDLDAIERHHGAAGVAIVRRHLGGTPEDAREVLRAARAAGHDWAIETLLLLADDSWWQDGSAE